MTLARNEAAVHETHGTVEEVAIEGAMGQVVRPIDLRIFLSHWHVGFAVAEETRSGLRDSFQVFDRRGTAVLKVHAVEGADRAAWNRLRDRYACASEAVTAFAPRTPPAPSRRNAEIDRDALREGWLSLEHTDDFHRLLRQTGAGREQALRLADYDLARPVGRLPSMRCLKARRPRGCRSCASSATPDASRSFRARSSGSCRWGRG
jgi:putative hemin transport protein